MSLPIIQNFFELDGEKFYLHEEVRKYWIYNFVETLFSANGSCAVMLYFYSSNEITIYKLSVYKLRQRAI